MAFQIADRVKETTTTTGTGTLNLGGAVSQFVTFVSGIGNGNETYYSIEDPTGTDWEVGIGTVTSGSPDTLSRDTVISSSNAGSLVNFGVGSKVVFSTQPASKTVIVNTDTNVNVSANINATSFVGSGASLTSLNASNLSSGTLPDARFPATLPAISGVNLTNLTNLDASNLASGTVPDARFPATLPNISGANLTNLNGSNVSSGTVADARLSANVTLNNASTISAGTLADGRLSGNVVLTSGATFTGNVALGDLDYILMGPTGEYQIYHDHANGVSVIKDADVGGSINVQADTIKLTGTTNVNSAYTLPTSDGTSGQVLTTNGSGAVSFGTINLTTINNNADNRIITGSGTADTLNAESGLTYDGSTLAVTGGATFTANVSLGDNDYLRFGASSDLIISHNGTNSQIKDNGTGSLYIQSDGAGIVFANGNATELYTVMNDNGSVDLYYNGSKKLETTATGISVTGTVVESSSLAYKENVQPLEFNEAIYNVNAVKYDRKDGSSKDEVGVIAEELYEILPDLVECKDGKPDAVKYTKMTMYLLEALKKQNQEIQLLKEKLNGQYLFKQIKIRVNGNRR